MQNDTSTSFSEDNGCVKVEDNAVSHQMVGKPLETETEAINSNVFKNLTATRKHKKVGVVELKISKALEPKETKKN